MSVLRPASFFAAGAVLASVLTFTGIQSWTAGAAPGTDDTTFVPVAPCRLFDTRPGTDNVGPRNTPLGTAEVFTAQVTGSNGNCVGIPNDARAVAFNVTAVNPTVDSFLTLFPADRPTRPTASNLNFVGRQPPVPNKVDVKLSPDGKVKVYNHSGTVDVIADVVGYYSPGSLTELAGNVTALQSQVTAGQAALATLSSSVVTLQSELDAAEASIAELSDSKATVTRDATPAPTTAMSATPVTIRTITVTPLVDGNAVVSAFGTTAFGTGTDSKGTCAILTAPGSPVGAVNPTSWVADGTNVSTLRIIPVTANTATTFLFVCVQTSGASTTTTITSPDLFAVVIPN